MMFFIAPFVIAIILLLFTKPGIKIALAILLLATAARVLLIGTITFYGLFMPEHFQHLQEVTSTHGDHD
ncbi:hypothetical protein [Paeniglutamicibacter sp. NPDC091659]|uniref:hypothetical protein n=1 Tax=Paeniglutamicibacter sp. NPDC091659 TaxID=3364389 RepID=UPI00380AD5A4